jgi:hypothetical protein
MGEQICLLHGLDHDQTLAFKFHELTWVHLRLLSAALGIPVESKMASRARSSRDYPGAATWPPAAAMAASRQRCLLNDEHAHAFNERMIYGEHANRKADLDSGLRRIERERDPAQRA